jgi:hypothetical protein
MRRNRSARNTLRCWRNFGPIRRASSVWRNPACRPCGASRRAIAGGARNYPAGTAGRRGCRLEPVAIPNCLRDDRAPPPQSALRRGWEREHPTAFAVKCSRSAFSGDELSILPDHPYQLFLLGNSQRAHTNSVLRLPAADHDSGTFLLSGCNTDTRNPLNPSHHRCILWRNGMGWRPLNQ